MDYSIEQEMVWKEHISKTFQYIYKIKYMPRIGVVEASVTGGIVRYYVRPKSNALIPFYFSSRRWLGE